MKIRAVEPALMPVKYRCDLFLRYRRRLHEAIELVPEAFRPPVQNLGNQAVLALEVPIHGRLRDLCLGNDPVYAGCVEAITFEKAVGRFSDMPAFFGGNCTLSHCENPNDTDLSHS